MMFTYLKRFLAPPVFEANEEKTRLAALLHTIVLAGFTIATFYLIALPLLLPGESMLWTLVRYPPFLISWVLLRKGYVRAACAFFVTAAWASQVFVWANTAGPHPPSVAGVVVLVLIAGLLLGSRAAFLFAALSLAANVVIRYGVARGVLPSQSSTYTPKEILLDQAIWSILAALLLHLAMSSVNRALNRARAELTERKRAEEALRSSEAKFAKAFNASPLSMTIGIEGRIIDANDTFLKNSGYSREEVIGHTTVELNIYEKPEDRFKIMRLLKEEGAIHNLEINFRVKSGELRTHLLSAEIIELDGQQGVLMVANDVTERKQVEEALRASEERFSQAFNASPLPMAITQEHLVLDVNNSFLNLTDYKREEVVNHQISEINMFANIEDFALAEKMLREQKPVRNQEVNIRTKHGEVRALLYSAEVIKFGEQLCLLGAGIDITERKELEAQLRQSQKLQAVGQLAGGIAHDFNNVLTIIIGTSELLLRPSYSPAEPVRQKVEIIKDSAMRAAKLTQQLLAFSRQQVLEVELLNLNVVVDDILALLEPLIGEDIHLQTNLDSGLKAVKADRGQLEQVMLNLATNARDAMPRGGNLIIETSNIYLDETYAKQHIEVTSGGYVMLAISDTGIGMDAETLNHIFEPFFTTKPRGKGTGLGMAMVHGIVKQSGGHITIYSEPWRGTTIKIYLPQADAVDEEYIPEHRHIESLKGVETILVVEDESAIRQVMCEILGKYGYVVLEANSEQCLEMSESYANEIQLLVTDVVMPKMNGRELADQLLIKRPNLKVLYMSGYTDDVIVYHGILKPHIAFLQKPFTTQALLEKVRLALTATSPSLPN
ncbi:MAG: PAS domain S-box protein [Acidobacteriota bacterium]